MRGYGDGKSHRQFVRFERAVTVVNGNYNYALKNTAIWAGSKKN